jgi:hypothetical protein
MKHGLKFSGLDSVIMKKGEKPKPFTKKEYEHWLNNECDWPTADIIKQRQEFHKAVSDYEKSHGELLGALYNLAMCAPHRRTLCNVFVVPQGVGK